MNYRDSVKRLAAEEGATLVEDQFFPTDSFSNPEDMTLHVPYVEDEEVYAAALHELGHLHYHHRRPLKMDSAKLLDEEAAATEWAMEHYEGTPTKVAYDLWGMALSTYMDVYRYRWSEPELYFDTMNKLFDHAEQFATGEELTTVREVRKNLNAVRGKTDQSELDKDLM